MRKILYLILELADGDVIAHIVWSGLRVGFADFSVAMEHPFLFESVNHLPAWVVFKPTMETDGGVTELREEQYRKDAGTVLFQESTVCRNTTQEDRQL